MKGYVANIKEETLENDNFHKVVYTGENSQLVLTSLKPGEELGEEVHEGDQFIRVEEGECRVILDEKEHEIENDFAVIIPAGCKHNVVNISESEDLKIYSIYSPPEHRDGIVHATKEDHMKDTTDEFDGKTTEQ